MIALAVVTVLVLLQSLAVILILTQQNRDRERAWRDERRELLNRIQKPDYIPLSAPEAFEVPEGDPDEMHLVGMIADPTEETVDG